MVTSPSKKLPAGYMRNAFKPHFVSGAHCAVIILTKLKSLASSIVLKFSEEDTPELTLTLVANRTQIQQSFADLKKVLSDGKHLVVNIERHRQKRSLDANGLCWVLCQKIAETIGSTKELVYKKIIRDVGQFEIVPIHEDAVQTWIHRWGSRGLGWFAEVLNDSKLPNYKKVISYYGSSVYDTREMSLLIDEIIAQCKELDIPVMAPAEIDRLKQSWASGPEKTLSDSTF